MIALYILLGFAVIYILLTIFSAKNRFKRQLKGMPRTPIAHATGGLTKIVGQVDHCWPPLYAPLSGRPCVAYEVLVEEVEVELLNPAKRKLVPIIHEIQGQPFILYDETGRAFISYDDQTGLVIKADVDVNSKAFRDATPAMEALLARYGHSSTGFFGLNKAIRYHEGVLEAGEWVTVLGHAAREPEQDPRLIAAAAQAGYPPPMWTAMRAVPGIELRITDDVPPAPLPPPQQQAPLPQGQPPQQR